jgi:hypothetical protein
LRADRRHGRMRGDVPGLRAIVPQDGGLSGGRRR